MRVLIMLVLLVSAGCTISSAPSKGDGSTIGNRYEVIDVGPYTCVGMDGAYSGGVWCERTKKP